MDNFYLTLPSNVRVKGNTTSKYRTILPKSIKLQGSWLVALMEIHFPFSWYNLEETAVVDIHLALYDYVLAFSVVLHRNYYQTIQSLLVYLNTVINKVLKQEIKVFNRKNREIFKFYEKIKIKKDLIVFDFDQIHQRVSITIDTLELFEKIVLPKELLYLLGFNKQPIFNQTVTIAPYLPDLTGGVNQLYIYCDVVEPVIVGDVIAPLLRVVSMNTSKVSYGQNIVQKYSNPHYFPVTSKHLRDVLVTINDDSDQPIKFSYGKCLIQLHFKRAK